MIELLGPGLDRVDLPVVLDRRPMDLADLCLLVTLETGEHQRADVGAVTQGDPVGCDERRLALELVEQMLCGRIVRHGDLARPGEDVADDVGV